MPNDYSVYGGGVLMPKAAAATTQTTAPTTLDLLLDRGRAQGHLSLAELREAFAASGISPAEGRSILRDLSDAGVSLAADKAAADKPRKTRKPRTTATKTTAKPSVKDRVKSSGTPSDEAAFSEDEEWAADEAEELEDEAETTDLDDNGTVMGDSVHTYLKSIGRRTLLTAAQEVELARRIEAGLYAEYKLETALENGEHLPPGYRDDLEWVIEDGRRAKD